MSLRQRLLSRLLGLALIISGGFGPLSSVTAGTAAKVQPQRPRPMVDLYMLIGENPIWFGSSLGYTVYQTSRVEARIMTAAGEIVLIFNQGDQQPGQYTLPFDGTRDGSPLAGYYTFELYFGDEYAAKYQMIANPLPQPL